MLTMIFIYIFFGSSEKLSALLAKRFYPLMTLFWCINLSLAFAENMGMVEIPFERPSVSPGMSAIGKNPYDDTSEVAEEAAVPSKRHPQCTMTEANYVKLVKGLKSNFEEIRDSVQKLKDEFPEVFERHLAQLNGKLKKVIDNTLLGSIERTEKIQYTIQDMTYLLDHSLKIDTVKNKLSQNKNLRYYVYDLQDAYGIYLKNSEELRRQQNFCNAFIPGEVFRPVHKDKFVQLFTDGSSMDTYALREHVTPEPIAKKTVPQIDMDKIPTKKQNNALILSFADPLDFLEDKRTNPTR